MSQPVDAKGLVLCEGDLVCYTTNSRGSGLQFGNIAKIKTATTMGWRYDYLTHTTLQVPVDSVKIIVHHSDALGIPKFQNRYDDLTQTWIDTNIRTKSGYIEYSENKFLKL